MDKFVEDTQQISCSAPAISKPRLVMDYYDGNTVTALWNYAQHFAMSDDSYDTVFGPSTPGALTLVSGHTPGASPATVGDEVVNGTIIGDLDPTFDDCSTGIAVAMSGPNVGDLLNHQHITWDFPGWLPPHHTSHPSYPHEGGLRKLSYQYRRYHGDWLQRAP